MCNCDLKVKSSLLKDFRFSSQETKLGNKKCSGGKVYTPLLRRALKAE